MSRDFDIWMSNFRDSIADYGYYIDFDKVYRTAGTFYDSDPCNGNYGRISAERFCGRIFCTAYDRGTDKGRSRCTTEHSENRMYDHCNNTAFLCKSSVWRAGSKTSGDEKSG